MQASCWEHKCLIAQEALVAAQEDAQRLHKQAAASAAAVQKQQKLLEQLSTAEAALADSHSSAQRLLQQLGESQAGHRRTEQELEGEAAINSDTTYVLSADVDFVRHTGNLACRTCPITFHLVTCSSHGRHVSALTPTMLTKVQYVQYL